ncbi:SDR family oxidoreductase [Allorhizobium sp. BGMRC 0089]|uniref:SDR family oxidoreductase n=1 Tax=Allorhizobium sonneratiae TaxID=2934936 RepID=UPI0020336DE9|nr:SDR family oxidoreductase [Allorhizobium sonneratiae]MCM2294360.1 SDR family oxidoreductase [Allorhizobium sonneratiae]
MKKAPDHVIITGGSSGIGLALARLYLDQGAKVSLIARSSQRLEAARQALGGLAAEKLGLYAADVTDFAALSEAIHAAEAASGPCDLLITSAGVVQPARLVDADMADIRRQIDTNLIGTIHAAKILWADMAMRGGTMLFISSGAAFIGLYGYAPYCASKTALVALAESLRMEARDTKLKLALCFPPDTDTPQLAEELKHRAPEAERVMGTVRPWAAEAVARHMDRALQKGRLDIHFGPTLFLLARFGSLVRPLLYWWYGRP